MLLIKSQRRIMSEHLSTNDEQMNPGHMMKAWFLDAAGHEFGDDVTELIENERKVPVMVGIDQSLRAKVIDACGMTCVILS